MAEARRKADLQHAEIEKFRQAFEEGQPDAIVRYFSLVLDEVPYPKTFPNRHRLALVPESTINSSSNANCPLSVSSLPSSSGDS